MCVNGPGIRVIAASIGLNVILEYPGVWFFKKQHVVSCLLKSQLMAAPAYTLLFEGWASSVPVL